MLKLLPARRTPALVAAVLAAAWVLANLDAPLVEDSLFWWVPKGLMVAELGPRMVLAEGLPTIMQTVPTEQLPPQWQGGLPDYAHPPLWYWWLGLWLWLSPTVWSVHLACLLPAVLAAWGFAELGGRLGSRWSGLAVFCLPPFLAQLLRPELDLPLLAITPWLLLALLDRRWDRFVILGFLAPWLKEPGVLFAAPAVLACLQDRRLRLAAFSPLLGLGVWALAHGGLAQPERLPLSLGAWLGDAGLALRILVFEQGRWLLLVGIWGLWQRGATRQRAFLVGGTALVWWLFFSTVGFFAGQGTLDPLTHVRYFLPGLALLTVLLARRWPLLALAGLAWLRVESPYGPEASAFGLDAARAERDSAPWIAAQVAEHRVWVGSYQAAALTQPWAGQVDRPIEGLAIYALGTDPRALAEGDFIVEAAYGEPVDALLHSVQAVESGRWTRGEATVVAWQVTARWDAVQRPEVPTTSTVPPPSQPP